MGLCRCFCVAVQAVLAGVVGVISVGLANTAATCPYCSAFAVVVGVV